MGFNKAQNEAIMHGKGPCQVLAGPGSGKTLTIVNRIKYLIERYEVRPEEILVVTFTRFAAAEMKSRLCSLMGKSNVPVTAGTFHGIYYGILKWAYRLGPDNILSEEEKYRILRRVSEDCGTEAAEEEDFLHDIAEEIGLVKNNGLKIGQFVSKKCRQDTFRELYEKYEAQRKAVRKLDFDDMLVLCKDLFVSHPSGNTSLAGPIERKDTPNTQITTTSIPTRTRVVRALLVGDTFIIDANRLSITRCCNALPY